MRQPIVIVPPLIFPLFLLAINASGLSAATNIAQDIGSGFFNRLSLTPMSGSSLLAGQLTGVLLIGTLQAVAFLGAGLAAGAHLESGPLGVPVLFALSLSIAAAFGAIGLF